METINLKVNSVQQQRVAFIDIAKGLGIIWVLIGHTPNLPIPYYGTIAFSFHMPLFFILSGMCFKRREQQLCFANSFKRLVFPYLFTILLFLAFNFILKYYNECKQWIWGGVHGLLFPVRYGLWFYAALFWGKILLNDLIKFSPIICFIISVLLAYLGIYTFPIFTLPYGIQNGCIALLFLYIGVFAKQYNVFDKSRWYWLLFCFIIWGIAVVKGFGYFTLYNCKIELIQIITSCCACYVVINFSKLLSHFIYIKDILSWIGKRTSIIFSFHLFELHTGISQYIAECCFNTDNACYIFFVRCVWCFLFAGIIPKIPYIKKIYSM